VLRAALEGLASAPVRVVAVFDPARARAPIAPPANAVLRPWISYAATMPACDLVILHGGHGTLARALASGLPVLVCPAGGDMPENAARADWAGVGVRLPRRLLTPRTLRLAAERALGDPALRSRAEAIAAWARRHDGPTTAAAEVENWAAGTGSGTRNAPFAIP
jgi:UDP:flavonoid glycosyltransferase YjiC (YdhE family)